MKMEEKCIIKDSMQTELNDQSRGEKYHGLTRKRTVQETY